MSCEVLIKTRFSFRPLKYKSLPRHARNTRSLVATQTKVDPTAKKTKAAPAPAQAGAGVTNLGPKFDPFETSDPFGGRSGAGTPSVETNVGSKSDKIHIRLQQRNGRKTLTTVQGVPVKYDPKKLVKAMKKEFACNGTVRSSVESSDEDSPGPNKATDFGEVLQLSGDQRNKVKDFLVARGLVTEKEAKDLIVIHGY